MALPLLTIVLILAGAVDQTHADAMVSGTVFCDQCKDGQVTIFDYPLLGMKVSMSCPGRNGQLTTLRQENTNLLGNYAMRIEGTPDLRGCYVQVLGSGQGSSGCAANTGPPQNLRLMFSMFDMAFYTVDPLISQPAQPMSFCPRSSGNPVVPAPVTTPATPPPVRVNPAPHPPFVPRPLPSVPRMPPLPQLPPMPPLPPVPPMPFLEASACPHQMWTSPDYQCYWRVLRPDTRVALVFGPLAARRYGNDITLRGSMDGRGDPYRTLLREGTTALLNSYNSVRFPYNPLGVIEHMNWALMGSNSQVLHTAYHFMMANAGNVNMPCRFTTCR